MVTERLRLVPATIALCDAEVRGADFVARTLGATVPDSWPPPVFEPDDVARVRQQLVADPTASRWTLYYVLRQSESGTAAPALIGIAGFIAPPTRDGIVEIGYAIVPQHQRQGFATEAVNALLELALTDASVRVVVATAYVDLHPSIRVLQKAGFSETAYTPATGLMRFEYRRSTPPRPAA